MALTRVLIIFAVVVGMVATSALAKAHKKEHIVGADVGWTDAIAYKPWVDRQHFKVGDTLVFDYTPGEHNVQEVTKPEYDNCKASSTNKVLITGKDRIPLKTAGEKWFICSVEDHCDSGKAKQVTMEDEEENRASCIQPPLTYPWLLFKTGGNGGYICCTTSPLYTGFSKTLIPSTTFHAQVYNCCYGWLIMSDLKNKLFNLFNPVTSTTIKLPPLPFDLKTNQRISGAVLSSPPAGNNRNSMIMLFHDNPSFRKDSVIYCTLSENRWCKIITRGYHLCDPIIMNGSVYAVDQGIPRAEKDQYQSGCANFMASSNQLVCINQVSSLGIETTKYCDLPSLILSEDLVGSSGHLVESRGELFFVIIHWIDSLDTYDKEIVQVEALKLDQESMSWNKAREVGDRVFFINETYTTSSMKEHSGGFVYYVNSRCLYCYNFADNCVSTGFFASVWNLQMPFAPATPILYMSNVSRLINGRTLDVTLVDEVYETKIVEKIEDLYREGKIKDESNFFSLADELIKFIARFLSPVDYLNFRSVSKTCRLLLANIEWGANAVTNSALSPWLMSSDNHSGFYDFVDSKFCGKYCINIPKTLTDAKIVHSKNGWLLMSTSLTTLYFYNPFTIDIIKLPELPFRPIGSWSIGFSSAPKSSKCIVAAIYSDYPYDAEIYIFQVGKDTYWEPHSSNHIEYDLDSQFPTIVHRSYFPVTLSYPPVFHGGQFYVLVNKVNLGVLNIANYYLDIHTIPEYHHPYNGQHFLLESGWKLLLVWVGDVGQLIKVFALDLLTMCWIQEDNLEDRTLYLCKSSSFSTQASAQWMKNTIFFPRLYENSIVYYSMTTGKYHTVANKKDAVEYHDTKELLISGWIEPTKATSVGQNLGHSR